MDIRKKRKIHYITVVVGKCSEGMQLQRSRIFANFVKAFDRSAPSGRQHKGGEQKRKIRSSARNYRRSSSCPRQSTFKYTDPGCQTIRRNRPCDWKSGGRVVHTARFLVHRRTPITFSILAIHKILQI